MWRLKMSLSSFTSAQATSERKEYSIRSDQGPALVSAQNCLETSSLWKAIMCCRPIKLRAAVHGNSDINALTAWRCLSQTQQTARCGEFFDRCFSLGSSPVHVLSVNLSRGNQFDLAAGESASADLNPEWPDPIVSRHRVSPSACDGVREARSEFQAEILHNPAISSHDYLGVFTSRSGALLAEQNRQTIKLLPDIPCAYFYLGKACLTRGQQKGRTSVRQAIQLYGNDAKTHSRTRIIVKVFRIWEARRAQRELETARELHAWRARPAS